MALIPGFYTFAPLQRDKNKRVDCVSIESARKEMKPGNTTDLERKKLVAQIWNWGGTAGTEPEPVADDTQTTGASQTDLTSIITPLIHSERSNINTASAAAALFKSDSKPMLVVENTLYRDLERALYGGRFDPPETESPLYKAMYKEAERFLICIILVLNELEGVLTTRPISHVVADVISCIQFFRKKVISEDKCPSKMKENIMLLKQREKFWKEILTTHERNFPNS
jgi:hypothetical protein